MPLVEGCDPIRAELSRENHERASASPTAMSASRAAAIVCVSASGHHCTA